MSGLIIHSSESTDLTTHVKFSQPKVGGLGKFVFINDRSGGKFFVQTPPMKTFGIDAPYAGTEEVKDKKKETFSLRFPPDSRSPSEDPLSRTYENFMALNEFVLKTSTTEPGWSAKGKKVSVEVMRASMTPIVKNPIDTEGNIDSSKDSTMRVKLADGNYDVFNHKNELIFPKEGVKIGDVLKGGDTLVCLLRFSLVWFASGRFGVSIEATNVIVMSSMASQPLARGVCHISRMPDMAEANEAAKEAIQVIKTAIKQDPSEKVESTIRALQVDDSGDEADPDAEYTARP